MGHTNNWRFVLAPLVLLIMGCADTQPEAPERSRPGMPQSSLWNGSVQLTERTAVPFQMDLDLTSAPPSGYFLVGNEKTPIPEISVGNDTLTFRFSEYGAEMQGAWDGSRMSGNYLRIRSSGTKSLPFVAAPAASAAEQPNPITIDGPIGNYQVLFQAPDKVDDSTVATLWTENGGLYGTFIAPDGDYGLLAAKQIGSTLQLNRFTGWQAIVITLEQSGGTWSGQFYAASNDRPRHFILQPRSNLNAEPGAAFRTVMKNPAARFTFSGLTLSGETLRDTDPRLKGKALIVDIMGTWCHNCLDEAPVLQQLQSEFGDDLQIVGLSFEISDDPAVARKNLQMYKDRFGLTYTLLFCGSLDEENVKKQIHSQLDNFFAYPTTIFIDKNHKVRSIHSGFKGPGTGEEFQKQIAGFRALTKRLVQ